MCKSTLKNALDYIIEYYWKITEIKCLKIPLKRINVEKDHKKHKEPNCLQLSTNMKEMGDNFIMPTQEERTWDVQDGVEHLHDPWAQYKVMTNR